MGGLNLRSGLRGCKELDSEGISANDSLRNAHTTRNDLTAGLLALGWVRTPADKGRIARRILQVKLLPQQQIGHNS